MSHPAAMHFGTASLRGEAVVGVARESAGEVLAHVAVGDLLGGVHQNLRTVVKLWDTFYGKQQGQRLFQRQCVLPIPQETVCVMVLDESHHARRVRIEIIIAERVFSSLNLLSFCHDAV